MSRYAEKKISRLRILTEIEAATAAEKWPLLRVGVVSPLAGPTGEDCPRSGSSGNDKYLSLEAKIAIISVAEIVRIFINANGRHAGKKTWIDQPALPANRRGGMTPITLRPGWMLPAWELFVAQSGPTRCADSPRDGDEGQISGWRELRRPNGVVDPEAARFPFRILDIGLVQRGLDLEAGQRRLP